jgi:hypothetical protein
MPKKSSTRSFIVHSAIIAGVCAIGMGAFFWNSFRIYSQHRPPDTVQTMQEFLAVMSHPEYVYELRCNGQRYIELVGPMSKWVFPSGPPTYIFDEQHQLIDWTYDNGEDPDYTNTWYNQSRRLLSDEEAAAILSAP